MSIERRLKRDVFIYLILNNEHFEDLSNYTPTLEYYNIVKQLLNEEWKIRKEGIWFVAYNPRIKLPQQGWKIHISGTILNAEKILKTVVPLLMKEKTVFKFICDSKILGFVNSKNYNRASSGKFITIYPNDEIIFKSLIEKIYILTREFSGPYIFSDKNYRDSKSVFYRYGGFQFKYLINIFGEKIPVISTPSGNLIPDERLPYFFIPEGIKDPFEEAVEKNEEIPEKVEKLKITLNQHYLIEEAIMFSNKGGVYKAKDLRNNNQMIIKEARPLVDLDYNGNDAINILKKEFRVLNKMQETGFVPKVIDLFQEWEHWFLVMEYIDGVILSNYRAVEGIGLILRKNWSYDIIKDFYEKMSKIIEQLVRAISFFHNNGIIIGDVSPNNIIINMETLRIKFIDFEGAYLSEDKYYNYFYPIFTSGFASPEKLRGQTPSYEDDYYALGSLIYSLILPVNETFKFDESLKDRFLKEILTDTGLPHVIQNIILGLMNKDKAKRLAPDKIIHILENAKI